MKRTLYVITALLASTVLAAQTPPTAGGPLTRHYHQGETLAYHMTATNDDLRYTADVSCVTGAPSGGSYAEECRWTAMTYNGQPVAFSPETAQFRQTVSLDPGRMPAPPDFSKADPRLTGPILDFFTFYIDLWLANKVGTLQHPGDHFYIPNPQPNSWADGTRVLIGKDQIDFDLNLQAVDPAQHTVVAVVHHVPSAHSSLQFPAEWMQAPVADTPNNWIEVAKTQDGKFQAGSGKETFDNSIVVSTVDGTILSATMENPVVTSSRVCDDAALTICGPAQRHTIHRHVEIALQR